MEMIEVKNGEIRTNGVGSTEYGQVGQSNVWAGVGFSLSALVMLLPVTRDFVLTVRPEGESTQLIAVAIGATLAAVTSVCKGLVSLGYIRARTDLKKSLASGKPEEAAK